MIINFEKSRTTGKTTFKQESVNETTFKKTLAEAKFAIVLDVTKLQSTEFTKKSTTINSIFIFFFTILFI